MYFKLTFSSKRIS